ncbi:hypothetical protein DH2020_036630 [Rehmannia glutinosa]|uniref:Lon N-terminal domain-containing protein n=1 Tax=Rehmannia glutinosa TaxID=99300 RepID=A0ABR0V3L7_REHGL
MITIIPNLSPLNSPVISPLYISKPCFSFPSVRLNFPSQRRRFRIQASSLVLPLLPFPVDQVLVPSEAKTLHLYEARYIALLEESLFQKNKLFVHFVLDPIGFSGTSVEPSFAAKYGCLVIIEKVERLEIGALVLIRGVGRVKVLEFKQNDLVEWWISKNLDKETRKVQSIEKELLIAECMTKEEVNVSNSHESHEILRLLERKIGMVDRRLADFELSSSNMVVEKYLKSLIVYHGKYSAKGIRDQVQPYLTGEVTPFQDNVLHETKEAPKEALLQAQTTNSLFWAEKQLSLDYCIEDFVPPTAERVSFAALQPVSGATQSELLKLQREKLTAMDVTDTVERLEKSMEIARNNISMLAAKLAIQSLEMS